MYHPPHPTPPLARTLVLPINPTLAYTPRRRALISPINPTQARNAAAVKRACAEAAQSHGLGIAAGPAAGAKAGGGAAQHLAGAGRERPGGGAGAGPGKGGHPAGDGAELNLILFDELDVVFAEVTGGPYDVPYDVTGGPYFLPYDASPPCLPPPPP